VLLCVHSAACFKHSHTEHIRMTTRSAKRSDDDFAIAFPKDLGNEALGDKVSVRVIL
jgi:hypothetical protein